MSKNRTNLAVKTEVEVEPTSETSNEVKTTETTEIDASSAEANAVAAPNHLGEQAEKTETVEMSVEQRQILESSGSKSAKIRGLLATGMKRGAVAKALGIRYQFVRNVEITPVKKTA